ncbi:MAG: sigma-70 family RNA polymerase sigma factor [Treponema sp.]|jgi:RNA polymerase sigma-70 factor (ECF subfamily)|nr:sigma-70 family RNA polymerase sigma factor [Treponema sp.]
MKSEQLIPGEDDEERIILEQIRGGQKEVFGLLVKKHQQAVFNMGLSFFRNGDDASDFAQDVFLKVYRGLDRFEGRSRFSTWLYKIAYNTAVNSVSRKKEYRSLAEDDFVPGGDNPERSAVRSALKDAVCEAVGELPERYRICIDLFFFYDRSFKEIEAITGFPVNTVKSHVFRAKKILRRRLGDFVEGGIE